MNESTLGYVGYYAANGTAVSGTSTMFLLNQKVGIGTTTPSAKLDVWSVRSVATSTDIFAVSNFNTASTALFRVDDAGDAHFANDGLWYEASSTITYINSLETGNMSFEEDAGLVSWINLPVATSTAGLEMSYAAMMDDVDLLTIYGTTDGSGGATNLGVAIGTSTPWAIFDIMNKLFREYAD